MMKDFLLISCFFLVAAHFVLSEKCINIASDQKACIDYKYINKTTLEATATVNGEVTDQAMVNLENPTPICSTADGEEFCLDYRPTVKPGSKVVNVCSVIRTKDQMGSKSFDFGCTDVPMTS